MPDKTNDRPYHRAQQAQVPLADRMALQNRTLNVPMECPECGSSYFSDCHFAQYNDGGYGSVQFRLLTVTPIQAKICACGHVLWPRPTGAKIAPGADPEFQRSMKAASQYREKQQAQAAQVASVREVRQLEQQVADLRALVEELQSKPLETDEMNVPSVVTPHAIVEVQTNESATEPAKVEEPSMILAAPPVEQQSTRQSRRRR